MIDIKKLAEYLAKLTATSVFEVAEPKSAFEQEMDKYDLDKQSDWRNVGTAEFPILGKEPGFSISDFSSPGNFMMPYFSTYGRTQRSPGFNFPIVGIGDGSTPPPTESPHDKLKAKIAELGNAAAVTVQKPSPDYVHTLTAWRGWDIDGGSLYAIGGDTKWEPKKAARASCNRDNHPAPQKNCQCGYWSFKTLDLMAEALAGYTDEVCVIGTVEIWGRVVECENGYRSEFAYPKELWLLRPDTDYLGWTYGVPVRKI